MTATPKNLGSKNLHAPQMLQARDRIKNQINTASTVCGNEIPGASDSHESLNKLCRILISGTACCLLLGMLAALIFFCLA